MTFEELKSAAKVFHRINEIRTYVTRDRFDMVAKTRFGIEDKYFLDVMYGMLNMTLRLVGYIAEYDDEETRKSNWYPKSIKYLPQAIEIAEAAFILKTDDWEKSIIPAVEYDIYRKKDVRRYFYKEGGVKHILDVCLSSRSDIMLLSELLNKEDVTLHGVAEHIGFLEGEMKGNHREKFQYFDGDIYLLYANPAARIFYDFSCCGDAGVYVATNRGWRKLLYTPTRGYVTKAGELDFIDDKTFYSNHMLEGSGKGFLYVGNIHDDCSVLMEKTKEN